MLVSKNIIILFSTKFKKGYDFEGDFIKNKGMNERKK
jgi:hypothetical protein